MKSSILVAALMGTLTLFSNTGRAQCPAGFQNAGALYAASGPPNNDVKSTKSLLLPAGVHLDRSYQQASVKGSGGDAGTDLTAAKIPKGILIIPSGNEGNRARWAVSQPKLEPAGFDANDTVTQWSFSIYMYADGGSFVGAGGSNVNVQVCYKSR